MTNSQEPFFCEDAKNAWKNANEHSRVVSVFRMAWREDTAFCGEIMNPSEPGGRRGWPIPVSCPSAGLRLGRLGGIGPILFVLLAASLIHMALPAPSDAQDDLRLPHTDAGVFDPRQGPIRIEYRVLKDAPEVEVLVMDFRGQVAERMNFVELRAGDQAFEWRGLDENREVLPDGPYRFEIRVVFADGHREEGVVEVRIAAMREEPLMPPPDLLPREEPYHRIDGSLSTFWRRNSEDPEHADESGEHRVWTRLRLKGEDHRFDGVFSMRRPYSGYASYEGSSAMAEKTWKDGRIRGVFRQGLGNLDDPMKLFSDFRTERKKAGARLDHDFGRADVNLIGFAAEGDVDSMERGGAFRLGLEGPRESHMGLTMTGRKAFLKEDGSREGALASAMDLAVPIRKGTVIQAEAVETRNAQGVGDRGWILGVEHDSGAFRASGGYMDLGEDFTAPFADPLRRVQADARGLYSSVDVVRPKPGWVFQSLACSVRGFLLERRSTRAPLREGDASVRMGLARGDSVVIRWLGREEGEAGSRTVMVTARHVWSESWSSNAQVNTTRMRNSETWRWRIDTGFQESDRLLRIAVEHVRRTIDTSPQSPYEETGVRVDAGIDPVRAHVSARRNRRGNETGVNLFGRVAFEPELLHRYRLNAYLALGNRSAFETETQVEWGLEWRF